MKSFALRTTFRILSALPWPVLNGISSFCFFVLYFIVGYRKKVVADNLKRCFPDWSDTQLEEVMEKFYRHFCDLFIEVIKSGSFTSQNIRMHIRFDENEHLHHILSKGQKAILLFGHYHNWEWITQLCGWYFRQQHNKDIIGFFKTMRDPEVQQFMNGMRTRFGGELFSDKHPLSVLKRLKGGENVVLGTVADQTPPGREQMYMLNFLGTPTPFFTGPGWLAAAAQVPVYFGKWTKTGRHQYAITLEPIYLPESEPNLIKEDIIKNITIQYASKLEAQIREAPEYWLWSHRRWKYVS
jgi:Kdo2-lipid IVA lauroyltransferase/acyltransferase